jgi:hypothetical protein
MFTEVLGMLPYPSGVFEQVLGTLTHGLCFSL